jgi:hypothetical protein
MSFKRALSLFMITFLLGTGLLACNDDKEGSDESTAGKISSDDSGKRKEGLGEASKKYGK